MDNTVLLRACEGKTASNGGLNLSEFRRELSIRYPSHESRISALTRPALNDLCRQLLSEAPRPISNPIVSSLQRPILPQQIRLPQIQVPSLQKPMLSPQIKVPSPQRPMLPVQRSNVQDNRIDQLVAFIDEKYGEYDFDRGKEILEEDMHDRNLSYEQFMEAQRDRLQRLDEGMLQFLMTLKMMIERQKIHNMDKEGMLIFGASGFFIDSNLNVVIFNER